VVRGRVSGGGRAGRRRRWNREAVHDKAQSAIVERDLMVEEESDTGCLRALDREEQRGLQIHLQEGVGVRETEGSLTWSCVERGGFPSVWDRERESERRKERMWSLPEKEAQRRAVYPFCREQ
jgi:hypothetical protein